ncbi:STAS domain-containing protein [Cryptosporangium aurantiacum]|uniref:Anti-anti-sigma factor n=1 Tax=Cryptosporangium aurantiacum TaxID=134849 RepID=A0A1M7PRE8_9ACTN|nr:STAS domain-containing protein [Cryptosporangium aurantiacum]SHN19902.1 anti-anti-sigma factor [Cryptosporangium aurantiacum]
MIGQEFTHSVRRHSDGETVTATLTGDWDALVDGSLVAELDAVLDEGYRNIIIDAAALTFCDSSCLGQLVGLHRRTGERGGWLRVVAPPFAVRRPMELTGLDQVIEITDR